MRDAFGGIVNIVLVAIFLVIVSGILGLVVNYTKAFRMKNAVISTIEQYEGAASCFTENGTCAKKIIAQAGNFGYHPTVLQCSASEGYEKKYDNYGIFCVNEKYTDSEKNKVYTVITQVDIDIPIINRIMGLSIFQVHGDTRAIRK